MKNLLIILLTSFLYISASAQVKVPHIAVQFDDGDRTGNGAITYNIALAAGDSGMVVVDTPSKRGKAIASILRSDDHSTTFYPRQEGQFSKTGADSSVSDDFFGFDAYFQNWELDTALNSFGGRGRDGVISQGKQYESASPSFALWFRRIGNKSYLQLVVTADTLVVGRGITNPLSTGQRQDTFTICEIPVNTWTRFDFKFNWQQDYTGKIEVYIDRQLVRTINGPNLNKTYSLIRPKKPQLRTGVYWFGAKSKPTPVLTRRVYFDNISIGRLSEQTWDEYLNYFVDVLNPTPTNFFSLPWYIIPN